MSEDTESARKTPATTPKTKDRVARELAGRSMKEVRN